MEARTEIQVVADTLDRQQKALEILLEKKKGIQQVISFTRRQIRFFEKELKYLQNHPEIANQEYRL